MKSSSFVLAISLLTAPAVAQFSEGPSLFGRGSLPQRSESSVFPIRPFAGMSFQHVRGLRIPQLVGNRIEDRNDSMVQGYAGISGEHVWRRSYFSTSYLGSYAYRPDDDSDSAYRQSGFDQSLSLSYGTLLSRRLTLVLSQSGGSYRRGSGLGFIGTQGSSSTNPLAYGLNDTLTPVDNLVDTRTYSLASSGQLTFQKSQKLSFSVGGTGFWIQRTGLSGAQGAIARGDVSYRVSRRQQIGVYYSFYRFDLTRVYSESYIHNVGIGYARTLSPRWNFMIQSGALRLENARIQRVTLSPLVAALLGEMRGLEMFHSTSIAFEGAVAVHGEFRQSSVSLSYGRGVMPGNGVLLTSMRDLANISYAYNRSRNWSLGARLYWMRLSDQIERNRRSDSYSGTVSAGRRITGYLHCNASYGYARSQLGTFKRDYQTFSAGLSFAASPLSLLFW